MTMNRQLRRAQEKAEKKAEREKTRRKAARRTRGEGLRRRRASRKEAGASRGVGSVKDVGKVPKNKLPGRFSGALMVATVFFISLSAAVPSEESSLLNSIVGAGFYLLFGYFMVLWLLRRGTERALAIALVSGILLAIGVEVSRIIRPEYSPDLITLGLIVPGVVGGALLGRLVFFNTPVR